MSVGNRESAGNAEAKNLDSDCVADGVVVGDGDEEVVLVDEVFGWNWTFCPPRVLEAESSSPYAGF